MRVLLGMLDATSGSVKFDGKDISMLSTQDRINHGLAFVPQTKNVFPSMTVEENLQMGGLLEKMILAKLLMRFMNCFLYSMRSENN